jgi:serine/threonine protein kinase
VLFRQADGAWKVADFGLTMAGTSQHAQTTACSRGTPGYRAPELVNPYSKNTFTNKVDIWATGCILVELVSGVKAFGDDFKVHQYYLQHKFFKRRFDIPEIEGVDGSVTRELLSDTIHAMLETDSSKRPTAKELLVLFGRLSNLNETSTRLRRPSNVGHQVESDIQTSRKNHSAYLLLTFPDDTQTQTQQITHHDTWLVSTSLLFCQTNFAS